MYKFEWPDYYSNATTAPIFLYKILNLKEGLYLNDMTFTNPGAAQIYLDTYLKEQWDRYDQHKPPGMSNMEYYYYLGKQYQLPTDREYMFEIVEQ